MFFYIHAYVKFRVLNKCDTFSNKIGMIMWLEVIILRSLEKGGPVEILTRSSISPESQAKVVF